MSKRSFTGSRADVVVLVVIASVAVLVLVLGWGLVSGLNQLGG